MALNVLIPHDQWQQAVSRLHGLHVKVNSFGGLKFQFEGIEVDCFPSTLEEFFAHSYPTKKRKALRFEPYCLLVEQ